MDQIIYALGLIVGFLNSNSGALLAVTTLVYAIITGRMLLETKRMRQSQTEPHVFITVRRAERTSILLNMVIQNIGAGPAYKLRFRVEPDIMIRPERKLSDINLVRRGFNYLAPGQKIECMVANAAKLNEEEAKVLHEVTVAYQDKRNKDYEEKFLLDFTEYYGIWSVDESPFKGIVEKLGAIRSDISKITGSVLGNRIKVIAYTKAEADEEKRNILEQFAPKEQEEKPE